MAVLSRTARLNFLAVAAGACVFGCVVAVEAWDRNQVEVRVMSEWFPFNGMLLYQQVHSVAFELLPAFVVGLVAATRPVLLGALVAGIAAPLVTVLSRGGSHASWLLLSGHDLTPRQHEAAVDAMGAFLVASLQQFATAAIFGAAAAALGWYVRTGWGRSRRDVTRLS